MYFIVHAAFVRMKLMMMMMMMMMMITARWSMEHLCNLEHTVNF